MTTLTIQIHEHFAALKNQNASLFPRLNDVMITNLHGADVVLVFNGALRDRHKEMLNDKDDSPFRVRHMENQFAYVTVPDGWKDSADAAPAAKPPRTLKDMDIRTRIKNAFSSAHGGRIKDIVSIEPVGKGAAANEWKLVSTKPIKKGNFESHGLLRALRSNDELSMTFIVPDEWLPNEDKPAATAALNVNDWSSVNLTLPSSVTADAQLTAADVMDTVEIEPVKVDPATVGFPPDDEPPTPIQSADERIKQLEAEIKRLEQRETALLSLQAIAAQETIKWKDAAVAYRQECDAAQADFNDLLTRDARLKSGNWTLIETHRFNELVDKATGYGVQLEDATTQIATLQAQVSRLTELNQRQSALLTTVSTRPIERMVVVQYVPTNGNTSIRLKEAEKAERDGWRIVARNIAPKDAQSVYYLHEMQRFAPETPEPVKQVGTAIEQAVAYLKIDDEPIADGTDLDAQLEPELSAAEAALDALDRWYKNPPPTAPMVIPGTVRNG